MSLSKVVIGAATLLVSSGMGGWLWNLKADKGDLKDVSTKIELHVKDHALQRDSDNTTLRIFMFKDSVWKAEQREIALRNECHAGAHPNCDARFP